MAFDEQEGRERKFVSHDHEISKMKKLRTLNASCLLQTRGDRNLPVEMPRREESYAYGPQQ